MHKFEPCLVHEILLELGFFPVSETLQLRDNFFSPDVLLVFRTIKDEVKTLVIKEAEIQECAKNMDDAVLKALRCRLVPSIVSIGEIQKTEFRAWLSKHLERAEPELIYEREN